MTTLAIPHDVAAAELASRHGRTLSDVLARQGSRLAGKIALSFLDYSVERAGVAHDLTFAALDRRVAAVAAHLSTLAAPGDRVAVLAPQGPAFVVGFLGALRAGLIAVPLFSPDLPGHADRLAAVLADADPAVVLAAGTNREVVEGFVGDRTVVVVDAVPDAAADGWQAPVVDPDDVAYLQYTSGSTRLPAGVRITHANVLANAALPLVMADAGDEATLVSWLPLFHDMGLVFVVGGGLVGGLTAVLMDPIAFLMRPSRWIRALSGRGRTFTPAPNFAFDFCAKRIPAAEREGLDLSETVMFNGAEPVAARTLTAFYDAFEPHGFRRGAIAPSYGLAEATVYVTSNLRGDKPQTVAFDLEGLSHGRAEPAAPGRASVELAASGDEFGDAIAIADPETGTRLPDGGVGEIWVNSPSVGDGYWDKPAETAHAFGATLHDAGDLPGSPWLRTGDLGTVVEGRLFVTGRIKDLLIIDGRNHYPQDLEGTVEGAHEVIGHHRSAAFPVAGDTGEQAVVVAEISRHHTDGDWDPAEVVRTVKAAVSRDHGVALADVVLIAPDTIPRTTSGKIARQGSREAYQAGRLTPLRTQA